MSTQPSWLKMLLTEGTETRNVWMKNFNRPPEETACHTCDYKNECNFAYDPYNFDVEPFIDCLEAK